MSGAEMTAPFEQVIDLEGVGPAQVLRRVQRPDLAREVALEAAHARQQAQQREQEREVERHQEMAGGHEQGAEDDGARATQPAVGDESAGDRRQVNQPGVEAEDGGGQRHVGQRPVVDPLEDGAERGEAGDILDMTRQQELLDHVEHQQRLHAVVREPLPSLREGEVAQPARVAEKCTIVGGG